MTPDTYFLQNENNRKAIIARLNEIVLDKPFRVEIHAKQLSRTELQNRFLFGWVYAHIVKSLEEGGITIPAKTGEVLYTKEILHEIFKVKYLLLHVIETENGRTLNVYKSTKDLDIDAFSKFVSDVKNWCFHFWGIDIPDPPPKSIWRQELKL